MADRVTHERNQRNAVVGYARTGEAHGQRVVQGQAGVAGDGEQRCPPDFHRGNGVYVGENIPPPVLTEQVMQRK